MKLNGQNILNTRMVTNIWNDPDFDFQEIWDSIQFGTLLQFEEEVSVSSHHQAEKDLSIRICSCLKYLQDGDDIPVPAFVREGAVDMALLLAALEPFSERSISCDRLYFDQRNARTLTVLAAAPGKHCSAVQAYTLYLFLLLQLQFLPKAPIRERDLAFILQRLQESAVAVSTPDRMALCGNLVLRCAGNRVEARRLGQRSPWTCFYQCGDPIGGLAYTEELGLIAFTVDGNLCDCTPTRILSAAAGKRIIMASACCSHYVLLADDGSVISSLPLSADSGWSVISRVRMGLNTACGISGKQCGVVLYGARLPQAFSNVTAVDARFCDEQLRFAVLTDDGTLHCEQGPSVPDVSHACLVSRGCVYIRGGCAYLRSCEGGEDRLVARLPEDLEIAELHGDNNLILCGTAEKPYLFSLS